MQTRPVVTLPAFVAVFASTSRTSPSSSSSACCDHAGVLGQLHVLLQMTVIAMNGDEELRPQQIDHQPHLFLAAVPAHVDQARFAIVVDHVGLAAAKMVDDAVDAFLVAGNDAGTQHHGVAALDARVLVVVDRGAGESGHRLPLRAADQNQTSEA